MSVVLMEAGATASPNSVLTKGSWLRSGTTVSDSLLHEGVFVGFRCTIASAEIGAGTLIASHARIGRPDAPRTVVGAGAWIGARADVAPGVTVGAGAVIAAGAQVTEDVDEDAVVVGRPARFLRRRSPVEDGLPRIGTIVAAVLARPPRTDGPTLPEGWSAGADCLIDSDLGGAGRATLGDRVITMGRADGPSSRGGVRLGHGASVGDEAILEASGGIDIGDGSRLGRGVLVVSSGHDMNRRSLPWQGGPVTIGAGCSVGDGATLVGPLTIGDRAVVEPGALVVSDVPPGHTTSGVLQKGKAPR
ncbi:DapH/DapD/GlmU-related protein [Streptomyces sp. NPDC050095]|uniref:acyltransferase n=1 Tax=unclassified Streptomyces TaxID=2593676 RepID=UPI003419FB37